MKKNRHALAILMVITEAFFFSVMALCIRQAGDLPTMQKVFFRNAVAGVISMITLARSKEKFQRKKGSLPGLLARSIFGGLGVVCNLWAVDHIPLADANILNKMSPFFAIIFSTFLLKEVPDLFEWGATLLAFAGAACIVRPTAGIASLPSLIALIGGMGAGLAYTFVRKLGKQGERSVVIVAFFSVFTTLCCMPFMLVDYHPMNASQLLYLIAGGTCAALAQFAITKAYQLAPAKEISVFDYSQVLFASIWGIVFFQEVPDRLSLLGYAIIITTAIVKWYYNMHIQKVS